MSREVVYRNIPGFPGYRVGDDGTRPNSSGIIATNLHLKMTIFANTSGFLRGVKRTVSSHAGKGLVR